jgi:hypothetical protein
MHLGKSAEEVGDETSGVADKHIYSPVSCLGFRET